MYVSYSPGRDVRVLSVLFADRASWRLLWEQATMRRLQRCAAEDSPDSLEQLAFLLWDSLPVTVKGTLPTTDSEGRLDLGRCKNLYRLLTFTTSCCCWLSLCWLEHRIRTTPQSIRANITHFSLLTQTIFKKKKKRFQPGTTWEKTAVTMFQVHFGTLQVNEFSTFLPIFDNKSIDLVVFWPQYKCTRV